MTNPDNVGGLSPELCPFCGDEKGVNLCYFGQPAVAYAVTCIHCGADGPRCTAPAEAVAAWNRRELCRAAPAGGDEEVKFSESSGCVFCDLNVCGAPAGGVSVDGEMFICYLIDKCERETVTEESLHEWLADFLKNPRYHRPSAPAGSGEVEGLVQFIHAEISAANGYTIGRLRAALIRKLQQGAD